jgi:hypothetical protein
LVRIQTKKSIKKASETKIPDYAAMDGSARLFFAQHPPHSPQKRGVQAAFTARARR